MATSPFSLLQFLTVLSLLITTCESRLTRKERKEREAAAYLELREAGVSVVDHTEEGKALRDYKLRKKKRKGLIRKKNSDLTSVLFPGVTPEVYTPGEPVFMITELVQSKKTHVPFEFYDLPGCGAPSFLKSFKRSSARHQRKNLGARLQGMELKPAPYSMKVLQNMPCTALCNVVTTQRQVKWIRKLVLEQYRVHLTFDQLPVLMRSSEMNYAVRGYPLGFMAPPSYTGMDRDEYFFYNHLKFTITYQKDPKGVFITGYDVYPVSIAHGKDGSTCKAASAVETAGTTKRRLEEEEEEDSGFDNERTNLVDYSKQSPVNDPATYLPLRMGPEGEDMSFILSYEVEWLHSELTWADRWDVYLIGSPDDDIHFFAIINSLMIVVFLTGAIATIMIRTLRKDISNYNEMSVLEDGGEETGWKLVHGDVFRPPSTMPTALAVLVGTGAQIGMAFFITLIAAILRLLNPVKKGHTLTAILVVYVLCGSVSGYVSARIYKFCEGKNWKLNTLATAVGLPGILVSIFTILNVFLRFAGAATAVSFWTLLAILALWICVSSPLVFVGSFLGFQAERVPVPTKTHQISRVIPQNTPWYGTPPVSFLLGGLLPFGSVCIELFFIMSALWLHQIYYVMGFLLIVLLILAATCAQVSVVMTYLQLCAEDHRWWWKSFANCASAGVYLLCYSLWFLVSRLELVGFLPILVYLTYMSMISLGFGLFCGSVGFLCAFYFNSKIYGALKVD